MRIARLRIENSGCIRQAEVPIADVTALVGRNGAGKSTLIRALKLFYGPSGSVSEDDFYNRDTGDPIAVEVTWDALTQAEREAYAPYIDQDSLTVRKEVRWAGGKADGRYYGSRLQYAGFANVRAQTGGTERRAAYNALVESGRVADLTARVRSVSEADRLMTEWEKEHPGLCVRARDDGQFFGFTGVGVGKLERFTRFIHVPAVRDASEDAAEGRDSPLTQLMEMVVRSALRQDPDIAQFQAEVAERYAQLFSEERLPQLGEVAQRLTDQLRSYAANAAVELRWADLGGPTISLPQAVADLMEDGFAGAVSRKGHGLQRAFILTLLHFLASFVPPAPPERGEGEEDGGAEPIVPSLVIGIEEPELYQHPNRQRSLARVLRRLVEERGRDEPRNQVIFSTHSPYFVDIQHFDEVRMVRKVESEDDGPMETSIGHATLDAVAATLSDAVTGDAAKFTAASLRPRLANVMTPEVNEGFFADVVVLVEGPSDRAVLLACAAQEGCDFDATGISVVPVEGKSNLDRPLLVFRSLGIPCYVVFDGDKNKGEHGAPGTNELLLRLLKTPIHRFPATQVTDDFACFEDNLECQLRLELGDELYAKSLARAAEDCGYDPPKAAEKNVAAMAEVLALARQQGRESTSLKDIVVRVFAIFPQESGAHAPPAT
jgi:putative ATP-dependent endonuclease of OLD family